MNQPTGIVWFGRHEMRLFWRDLLAMLTAGKRSREWVLGVVAILFVLVSHFLAYFILAPVARAGIAPTITTLAVVTSCAFLFSSMMVSQAMESVTRAFYSRSDLDLILSSPASSRQIFAVRMVAIAFMSAGLATVLAGPFINSGRRPPTPTRYRPTSPSNERRLPSNSPRSVAGWRTTSSGCR